MKPIPEHLKSKVAALKQTLLLVPKSQRKEAVALGMKLARLKQERDQLKALA
jgi:hypothetical protein